MSYLDDMRSIFGATSEFDGSTGSGASSGDLDGGIVEACAQVEGETPLQAARRQLCDAERGHFHESPEGTFRSGGSRHGVGYAEAVATLDPQTGLIDVDIDAHLRVRPEAVKGTRKLFRTLNSQFIVPGLAVDGDGSVHFRPERPCDPLGDDNLAEWIGKGFSTLHAHAYMVAQINAGMEPWDVLQTHEREEKEQLGSIGESGGLGRLQSLLEALHG